MERKSDRSFRFGDSEEIKARIVRNCTNIKAEVEYTIAVE